MIRGHVCILETVCPSVRCRQDDKGFWVLLPICKIFQLFIVHAKHRF